MYALLFAALLAASAHPKKAVVDRKNLCAVASCAAPRCAGIACPDILESAADMEAGAQAAGVEQPEAPGRVDHDALH